MSIGLFTVILQTNVNSYTELVNQILIIHTRTADEICSFVMMEKLPPSSMCPEFPDQEPQFRSHECARAFSVCVCGGVRALLRVYVQVRALHCGAVRCVRACNKQVQKVGVVYAPVILCSLIRCTRGLKTENNVDSSILWRYQSKRATD